MADATDVTVTDNPDASRFELTVDGRLAELRYQRDEPLLVLTHTEVPQELEGHGLGGRLVRAALHRAEAEGLTLVPRCPFARGWLERHADELDGVAVDWPAGD